LNERDLTCDEIELTINVRKRLRFSKRGCRISFFFDLDFNLKTVITNITQYAKISLQARSIQYNIR